ncbi:MAG TPA: GntR family transcriptional regulator [Rhodopseudomonas sp.]|uniref:GntR family transcriptional regulator n=1 Tax=Rhodopseudomonas sp. TaxID=1078 RepID=UPI002EDA9B2E
MEPARITTELRTAIVRGDFRPGEPLRQDHIAERFGVSSTPVREAFRQLTVEGLVVSEPNRGVFVSELSVAEVSELTELRCLLEVQMMLWSMPRTSREDLSAATALIDAIDHSDSVDDVLTTNREFHSLFYRKAGRPHIMSIIDGARQNLERYLRIVWSELNYLPRSQAEHRKIVRMCQAGQETEMRSLLEAHIRRTGDVIIHHLNGKAAVTAAKTPATPRRAVGAVSR